jgi:hypothetical protein
VPHARWLNSGNETQLDTRLQLRQDFDLSRHLRAHGLPVPEVFVLHTGGTGTDFTIAQVQRAHRRPGPGPGPRPEYGSLTPGALAAYGDFGTFTMTPSTVPGH